MNIKQLRTFVRKFFPAELAGAFDYCHTVKRWTWSRKLFASRSDVI